ncbi:hypothetical protein AVEN_267141-1 [Araneus ventricosus]|uniref:Uncharacterized protein n=1 Tax=Araneus ventricosus TaxID=182803 RepID=A0A4Y2GEY1_ARAVE|nr:hypothetical protein AVEN_267141-1 [Araneus ventricosus]
MTRVTPEVAPPLQNSAQHQHLTHDVRFNIHQAHMHGGSSVESGFEPGALRSRRQDLTTRPPQPDNIHWILSNLEIFCGGNLRYSYV